MARLAGTVHVFDADGTAYVFGPDSEVPGWAAKLITNPKAWGEEAAEEETVDTGTPGATPAIPSRGGAGSGVAAWVEYAKASGYELDADLTRDEIIAALEAEGVPTA